MMSYFSFPLLYSGGPLAIRYAESGNGFSIIFYVLFVVAFIYFTYYVTKTVGMRFVNMGVGSQKKIVRSIDVTMLGADRRVSILEVAGVQYIVYSDRNGVTLLDKRTDLTEELISDRREAMGVSPFSKVPVDLSFKKTFDYILKKNRDEND